jgi:hypothetical protein
MNDLFARIVDFVIRCGGRGLLDSFASGLLQGARLIGRQILEIRVKRWSHSYPVIGGLGESQRDAEGLRDNGHDSEQTQCTGKGNDCCECVRMTSEAGCREFGCMLLVTVAVVDV